MFVNHKPYVTAKVIFQDWQGDYTIDMADTAFNCAEALDTIDLYELPTPAQVDSLRGRLDEADADNLFYASINEGVLSDWHGPFELSVIPHEYEEYYSWRQENFQPHTVKKYAAFDAETGDEIYTAYTQTKKIYYGRVKAKDYTSYDRNRRR